MRNGTDQCARILQCGVWPLALRLRLCVSYAQPRIPHSRSVGALKFAFGWRPQVRTQSLHTRSLHRVGGSLQLHHRRGVGVTCPTTWCLPFPSAWPHHHHPQPRRSTPLCMVDEASPSARRTKQRTKHAPLGGAPRPQPARSHGARLIASLLGVPLRAPAEAGSRALRSRALGRRRTRRPSARGAAG